MTKTVDQYIRDAGTWGPELKRLRKILAATDLKEEVKWGGPCYTYDGKNIVGMAGFKSYFGLWFFQGALLKDDNKVLINAQEGRTKAMRQWRMSSARDIRPAIIGRYVKEAIELARDGKQISPARRKQLLVPPELKEALKADKAASDSFRNMRLSLQREYANYIADAKRDDTKCRRIEKIIPIIKKGGGLHDKYR